MTDYDAEFNMPTLMTFIIALLGGLIGYLTHIPIGEMLGAMLAVLIAGRVYPKLSFPKQMLTVIQIVLGISVGAIININDWFSSLSIGVLIGLLCCMTSQIIIGYFWLTKRCNWSRTEAFLGAVPGALAAIIVMTDAQEKPSYRVIFTHSIRLIFLMVLASIIAIFNHASTEVPTELLTQLHSASYLLLFGISLAALTAGILLDKIGIPAPFMLTAMLLTAGLNSAFPQYTYQVPEFFLLISMTLIGGFVGLRMQGITLQETIDSVRSGVMVTLLSCGVTLVMAFIFSQLLNTSFSVLALSWVPGSLESMTAVAILLGLEPAFVMMNHIIRLTLLYLLPAFLGHSLLSEDKRV